MNKSFKIVLYILILIITCSIYKFSSQVAEKSNAVSKSITRRIVEVIPKYRDLDEAEKEYVVSRYNSYIRKYAHFTLYFLLGAIVMLLLFQYSVPLKRKIIISALLPLMYAVGDEVYQTFIPGRSGEIRDVLIDFTGICMGVAVILIIYLIKINKQRKYKRLKFN